ncbi:hypothetical protein KHU50_010746 [Colletotrichum sp. SAR 10_65]|nr:hypothetical protein KHU50_010746 [Colletotrichum sp. SAR 10_65]
MDSNPGNGRENIADWSIWMDEMQRRAAADETHIDNPTEPMRTTPEGMAEGHRQQTSPIIAPGVVIPPDAIIGAGVNIESGDLFESGFEEQRETVYGLNEDAATIKQDFSQYDPGKMLYLSPHQPHGPYGMSPYPNPAGMSSNSKVLSPEEKQMTRTELVFGYSPLVAPAKKEDTQSNSPPTDPAPSNEKDKDSESLPTDPAPSNEKDKDSESLPTDPGSSKEKKGKEKETKKDASTAAKKNKDYLLTVKIERLLSGGPEAGCQVLLCKATKVPKPKRWTAKPQNKDQPAVYGVPLNAGQLIVVKVFDPLFYGDVSNTDKGPWKATIMADGDLSRENAAYQHLWEKQKTGFPHLAPQYHGPWTFSLTSEHPKFKNQTRRVGAVVMEYIQGRSIEDLCPRNQHYRLVPPKGPTFVDFEKKKELDFNKQMRLKVLKKFMKYSVHQLHAGVEHWWPQPENVLITTDDRGKPRVVLIDYVSSMIDSKRKEPYGLFKDYPKPPHPWTQFSLVKLTNFAGWYPAGWSNEQFATWVGMRFGSLKNSNYTDPMTKKAGTQNESESDSEEEDAKGSTSVPRPSTPFEGLGRMMGSIRIKRSNQ